MSAPIGKPALAKGVNSEGTGFRVEVGPGSAMALWMASRVRWRAAVDRWLREGRPEFLTLEVEP